MVVVLCVQYQYRPRSAAIGISASKAKAASGTIVMMLLLALLLLLLGDVVVEVPKDVGAGVVTILTEFTCEVDSDIPVPQLR